MRFARHLTFAILAASIALAPQLAHAQAMTTITATNTQAGNAPANGTLCLRAVNAQGNPISISKSGGGFYLAGQPFCQTLTSGALAGSLQVPNPVTDSAPGHAYDAQVYDTTSGQLIDLGPIYGIGGSSWSLDTYVPTTSVPTTAAFTFTQGSGVPSGACTAPALYVNTATGQISVCVASAWENAAGGGSVTAAAMATAVAGQTGCTTAGNAWDPATDTCVPPSGSVAGPLQIPNLYTVVDPAQAVSPFAIQSDTVLDNNFARFSDGTPYYTAGTNYSTAGQFAFDSAMSCMSNPRKCSAAFLTNFMAKELAGINGNGELPVLVAPNLTSSCADVADGYGHYCAADGWIGTSNVLYLYCMKEGIGSSQCTTAYTTYVAAIKSAMSYAPRDATTHLMEVISGQEYICGPTWTEILRNTGLVASCNVYRAVTDADMEALATASGDATNATYFANDLAAVVAGIRSNLIDGITGMLKAATGQNSAVDDVPSSLLAVACDLSPVMAPCGILTSGQKTAIENYINTNYSTLVNAAGFISSSGSGTGWPYYGTICSTGGNCGSGGNYGGPHSGTQYQAAFQSYTLGWFALVLGQVNQPQVETLLNTYLNGADPATEWYDIGSGTPQGSTFMSLEAATAVAANDAFPAAVTVVAGPDCINKYGAQVNSGCGGGSSWSLVGGVDTISSSYSGTGGVSPAAILAPSLGHGGAVNLAIGTALTDYNQAIFTFLNDGGIGSTSNYAWIALRGVGPGLGICSDGSIQTGDSYTGCALTGGGITAAGSIAAGPDLTLTANSGTFAGSSEITMTAYGADAWQYLAEGGTASAPNGFLFVDLTSSTGPLFLYDHGGSSSVRVTSGTVLGWSSSGSYAEPGADTGISRVSADVFAFGNGTPGDVSGTIKATTYFSGTNSGVTKTCTSYPTVVGGIVTGC